MTFGDAAEAANVALAVIVLAVTVGRTFGKAEGRESREDKANGQPSVGEVSRRLDELKTSFHEDRREYLSRSEADIRFDGVWGAVKDLRAADVGQNQRIDKLMGQV